jgi:hypothetical protein
MPTAQPDPGTPAPKRRPGRPRGSRSKTFNSTLTAEERSTLARAAVYAKWAQVADRTAATRAAREARNARYYAGADAAGVTDPAQREAMANAAMRAEMLSMRATQLRQQRLAREAAS